MSDCKCERRLDQDIVDALREVMDNLENYESSWDARGIWEKLNKIVEENGK